MRWGIFVFHAAPVFLIVLWDIIIESPKYQIFTGAGMKSHAKFEQLFKLLLAMPPVDRDDYLLALTFWLESCRKKMPERFKFHHSEAFITFSEPLKSREMRDFVTNLIENIDLSLNNSDVTLTFALLFVVRALPLQTRAEVILRVIAQNPKLAQITETNLLEQITTDLLNSTHLKRNKEPYLRIRDLIVKYNPSAFLTELFNRSKSDSNSNLMKLVKSGLLQIILNLLTGKHH